MRTVLEIAGLIWFFSTISLVIHSLMTDLSGDSGRFHSKDNQDLMADWKAPTTGEDKWEKYNP